MPHPRRIGGGLLAAAVAFALPVAFALCTLVASLGPRATAQVNYPLLTGDPHWRGPVSNSAALPATRNSNGDIIETLDTHFLWIWDSTASAWSTSSVRRGNHGESSVPFLLWENISLSTSGVTSTGTHNLLPASSLIDHVDCVVTTTVTGSGVTGLQVGDGSTVDRFLSAGALALTAGSKAIGWNVRRPAYATTDAKGPTQAALAQVVVTAVGGTPTAGAVSCSSFGSTITAPAS